MIAAPVNAARLLAESEFNRFYIRALPAGRWKMAS
jgi:hypothetical protein